MKAILLTIMVSGAALAAGTGLANAATPAKPQAGKTAQTSQPAQTAQNAGDAKASAQSLQGKTVYGGKSQNIGVVDAVVRDKTNNDFLVVKSQNEDRKALIPANQVSENGGRLELNGEQTDLKSFPAYKADGSNYQRVQGQKQVALQQSQQNGGEGTAAQIMVQQQAPGVKVEEVAPKVEVSQAQPSVEVQQPTPEITVHQPAPTVTVNIPKPEITVRMPRPAVHVAQAQPQVEVHQQQPKMQVTQPQQQAQVTVDHQNAKPQVNVAEQGQPKIKYDQAQPKVTVNQEQGQPKVRVEQTNRASAEDNPDQNDSAGGKQADSSGSAQPRARTAQQRAEYMKEFGDAGDASAASDSKQGQTKQIQVNQLDKMAVYNARGDKLGTVDRTIQDNTDNKQYVVVAHGGFLGIMQDKVAFPLQRFALKGNDQLVIHGVTSDDISNMDNWRDQVSDHKQLAGNQQVEVSTVQ